jgi:hypothetical protein
MATSPIWAMVVLITAGFFVAGDSWWLLGIFDFTRSPGAMSPGMVVVAYSRRSWSAGQIKVANLGFLLCEDGDLPKASP